MCAAFVTAAEEVRHAELRVSVDSDPRPNIAPAVRFAPWRGALLLSSYEGPYLVGLQAPDPETVDGAVVELCTGASKIDEQLHRGILCDPGYVDGGPDARPSYQAPYDLSAAGNVKPVHTDHYAYVNRYRQAFWSFCATIVGDARVRGGNLVTRLADIAK